MDELGEFKPRGYIQIAIVDGRRLDIIVDTDGFGAHWDALLSEAVKSARLTGVRRDLIDTAFAELDVLVKDQKQAKEE